MGCISGNKVISTQQLRIGNFCVLRHTKLAQGAFGDVWKCKDTASDTLYALKEIRLQTKELQNMFKKEVSILQTIQSKHFQGVIKMLASAIQSKNQSQKMGRILFQFGTITLLDEVSSNKLSQPQILTILRDVSLSLKQIHSQGICHLDLKPENLVLVNGTYKLCDFGSAVTKAIDYDSLTKKERNTINQYIDANATLLYLSPQMVQPSGKVIGEASDVWALGCIAYLLVFRKHPFMGEGKLAILTGISDYPSQGGLTEIVRSMLTVNPRDRPSASTLVDKFNLMISSGGIQ